jgi:hypothetical protein
MKPRQQPFHRKGRQRIHPQHMDDARIAQLIRSQRDAVERGLHGGQIAAAVVGQTHALATAMEHLHAEPCFKSRDLPANCTVRHMQFVRRGGEAFMPCGGFEGTQRRKRRKITSHACDSRSQRRAQKSFCPEPDRR